GVPYQSPVPRPEAPMARRPACYLAVGLALFAAGLAGRPARGGADGGPPPPPAGPRARVERADGTTVEGTLAAPAPRIGPDHRALDLAVGRVKIIEFAADPG